MATTPDLFELAAKSLDGAGTMQPFVPGRIEFLGKHTDYAGGRSLLCAIDRGIAAVATVYAAPGVPQVPADNPA